MENEGLDRICVSCGCYGHLTCESKVQNLLNAPVKNKNDELHAAEWGVHVAEDTSHDGGQLEGKQSSTSIAVGPNDIIDNQSVINLEVTNDSVSVHGEWMVMKRKSWRNNGALKFKDASNSQPQ